MQAQVGRDYILSAGEEVRNRMVPGCTLVQGGRGKGGGGGGGGGDV